MVPSDDWGVPDDSWGALVMLCNIKALEYCNPERKTADGKPNKVIYGQPNIAEFEALLLLSGCEFKHPRINDTTVPKSWFYKGRVVCRRIPNELGDYLIVSNL